MEADPTASAGDADLAALSRRLGSLLRAAGRQVTTAESCTGGWIAKLLTDVAGSSDYFACGFVTYGNEAKTGLLEVPPDVLAREGAVSRAVVEAMAGGALRASGADLAVAVSGIAGPGGAVPGKPVGTVWLAWARRDGALRAQMLRFEGDRDAVRRGAVRAALQGLIDLLEP